METPDATNFTTGDTGTEFWSSVTGSVTYDTTQKKSGNGSWKADSGVGNAVAVLYKNTLLTQAGNRISFYIRFSTLPASTVTILWTDSSIVNAPFVVSITSGGILQLFANTSQIGSNGSTLLPGTWYRLCLAYTITSTTVYEVRLFLDGAPDPDITGSNSPTLSDAGPAQLRMGWAEAPGANKVLNFQHVYIDDSTALTDTGDIRVTAKLPTTAVHNNFDTTTGTGAVNERPISISNRKDHLDSTQVHQDYDIQAASAGEDISGNTYVAFNYWVWAARTTGPGGTPKIISRADTETAVTIGTAYALYDVLEDSATYPSAGASVIGMESIGSTQDTLFAEGGVLVAFLGDPIPELVLALAPLSFFAPKIIKSIQKGTLVEDTLNLLRRMMGYIVSLFHCSIARLLRIRVRRKIIVRRRRGKKDG